MNKPSMKRYYIGFAILFLGAVVIAFIVISEGAASKQDVQTNKKAQEAANKLNSYISKNRRIPESLSEIGVTDAPESIAYTKLSEQEYKFCVTYKADKSYGGDDITGVLWGSALRDASFEDADSYYDDEYTRSYLYLPYTYEKGENCQTIKPTLTSSYNYNSTLTPNTSTNSTTNKVYDTERKTDINSLHAQIEAYYAENGKYPTLANLNDSAWLKANMAGLDKASLKDPEGYTSQLIGAAYKGYYGYAVKASDSLTCDNVNKDCAEYTLTALLSDGTKYTKNSLN